MFYRKFELKPKPAYDPKMAICYLKLFFSLFPDWQVKSINIPAVLSHFLTYNKVQDDASISWRKRKKHFFILSHSGKPIYSRFVPFACESLCHLVHELSYFFL